MFAPGAPLVLIPVRETPPPPAKAEPMTIRSPAMLSMVWPTERLRSDGGRSCPEGCPDLRNQHTAACLEAKQISQQYPPVIKLCCRCHIKQPLFERKPSFFRGNSPSFLHFQQKDQERKGHLMCNWQWIACLITSSRRIPRRFRAVSGTPPYPVASSAAPQLYVHTTSDHPSKGPDFRVHHLRRILIDWNGRFLVLFPIGKSTISIDISRSHRPALNPSPSADLHFDQSQQKTNGESTSVDKCLDKINNVDKIDGTSIQNRTTNSPCLFTQPAQALRGSIISGSTNHLEKENTEFIIFTT